MTDPADIDRFVEWWKKTVSDEEIDAARDDWYSEYDPDAIRRKQRKWVEERYDAIPKRRLDKGRQEIVRHNFLEVIMPEHVIDLDDQQEEVVIAGQRDAKLEKMHSPIVEAAQVREAVTHIEDGAASPIDATILRDRIENSSKRQHWKEVGRLQEVADQALTTATTDEEEVFSVWQASIDTKKAAGKALPVRTRLLSSEFEDRVRERWLQYDVDIGRDGRPVGFRQWRPATNPDRAITDNDLAAIALIRENDFRFALQGGGRLQDVPRSQWLEEQQWRNYQGRLQDQYLA